MSIKYPRLSGVANARFKNVDDGEEPEELSNRVHKSRGGATSIVTKPGQTNKVGVSDEELSQLKLLIREEQVKNHETEKQLAEMKWEVIKINGQLQDERRVHVQERKKNSFVNNLKDAKIVELKSNYETTILHQSQALQDLQHENHRMENKKCALLVMIDKMSRSHLQYR